MTKDTSDFKCWYDVIFRGNGGVEYYGLYSSVGPYRLSLSWFLEVHLPISVHNHLFYISKGFNEHNRRRGGTRLGSVVVWCSAGMPTNFHLLVTGTKTENRTGRTPKASEIPFPYVANKVTLLEEI